MMVREGRAETARDKVGCILSGRGEGSPVRQWLAVARESPGFIGFASRPPPSFLGCASKLARKKDHAGGRGNVLARRYVQFVEIFEEQVSCCVCEPEESAPSILAANFRRLARSAAKRADRAPTGYTST